MTEQADAFCLGGILHERELQHIIAVEAERASGGQKGYHADEISLALRDFLLQLPAFVQWCEEKDDADGAPSGICLNIMVAMFSEIVRKIESDIMGLCDLYSTEIPYRRLVDQCAIIAMQQVLETLATPPTSETG